MLKLKRQNVDPPGGWYYEVESGFRISAGHFFRLVESVKKHLRANGESVPENLEELIQDQICRRIPHSLCSGEGPVRHIANFNEIVENTRKVVKSCRHGEQIEVGSELARRSSICVGCRFNQNHMGCFKCTQPYKLSAHAFPNAAATTSNHLLACDVLAVINMALVHATKDTVRELYGKFDTREIIDTCWVKPILEAKDDGDE